MVLCSPLATDTPDRARNRCSLLQQSAGLYRQDVERHLQLRDGFAEFGMVSDFLLQLFQNLVRTGDVLCGLGWVLLGPGFAGCRHGRLLPGTTQFYT